jgi:hypothetical protein
MGETDAGAGFVYLFPCIPAVCAKYPAHFPPP